MDWDTFNKLVAELEKAADDLNKRVEISTHLFSLTGERFGSDVSAWRSWASKDAARSGPCVASQTTLSQPLRLEPEYQRLAQLGLVSAPNWKLDQPAKADEADKAAARRKHKVSPGRQLRSAPRP